MYGHVYRMAEAVAEGARGVAGAQVALYQVPELVPEEALAKSGAKEARRRSRTCPSREPAPTGRGRRDHLRHADALRQHVRPDAQLPGPDGRLVAEGRADRQGRQRLRLAPATQHGGQETTITSFHSTLLHHGMIIVGVPYTEQRLMNMNEITGGSPTARRRWRARTARASRARTSCHRPVPGPSRGERCEAAGRQIGRRGGAEC